MYLKQTIIGLILCKEYFDAFTVNNSFAHC